MSSAAPTGILQKGSSQSRTRGRSKGKDKGGTTDSGRRKITMSTPRSIEKHKKALQTKLRQAMDENIRLKEYNGVLQEKNNRFLKAFGGKEEQTSKTGRLNIAGNRELNYKVLVFYKIKDNLDKLTNREQYQEKNLRGLVKFAKKLTVELEEYKQKVVMSEQILADLKKAGSDNMGNLIEMMKQFKEREANSIEEIEKLNQLTIIKDDELTNLDIEIKSLNDFLINVTRQQNDKITMYKDQIEENKKIIRRQDKMIVDLQQKNELSQNEVATTQDQVSLQVNKKDKLELRLREMGDQRNTFQSTITNLEQKIGTFRSQLEQKYYSMQSAVEDTEPKRTKKRNRDLDNRSIKSRQSAKRSQMSKRSMSSSPNR